MRLLVREAARDPGLGWLSYDSFFRQQAAVDPSLRWDTLHSDLFAITVADAAVSSGRARPLCRLCLEPDHASMDCALAQGLDSCSVLAMQLAHDKKPKPFVPGKDAPVCRSYNSTPLPGYRVNGCRFRHVCSACDAQHKQTDCPNRKGQAAA